LRAQPTRFLGLRKALAFDLQQLLFLRVESTSPRIDPATGHVRTYLGTAISLGGDQSVPGQRIHFRREQVKRDGFRWGAVHIPSGADMERAAPATVYTPQPNTVLVGKVAGLESTEGKKTMARDGVRGVPVLTRDRRLLTTLTVQWWHGPATALFAMRECLVNGCKNDLASLRTMLTPVYLPEASRDALWVILVVALFGDPEYILALHAKMPLRVGAGGLEGAMRTWAQHVGERDVAWGAWVEQQWPRPPPPEVPMPFRLSLPERRMRARPESESTVVRPSSSPSSSSSSSPLVTQARVAPNSTRWWRFVAPLM